MLPLSCLAVLYDDNEYQGFYTDMSTIYFGPMDFSFVVRSPTTRSFSFQVRKAEVFYDPDLENILNVFPRRPVFFKELESYKNISMSDYETFEGDLFRPYPGQNKTEEDNSSKSSSK